VKNFKPHCTPAGEAAKTWVREAVIVDHLVVQAAAPLPVLHAESVVMSLLIDDERSRTRRRSTGCGLEMGRLAVCVEVVVYDWLPVTAAVFVVV